MQRLWKDTAYKLQQVYMYMYVNLQPTSLSLITKLNCSKGILYPRVLF